MTNPHYTPLIETIENFIHDNGGRERLAHIIECEMVKRSRYAIDKQKKVPIFHQYTEYETKVLLDNYGKISARKIAKKLKRSNGSIYHKISLLRGAGIIKIKPFYHW